MTITSDFISCVIVEDEAPARLKLCEQLKNINDVQILGVASSVQEAETLINQLKPDFIFLDVKLSDANGFDLLNRINHPTLVVFTTAYSHYAADAFDVNAIDYLRKPYNHARLKSAIDKIRERKAEQEKPRNQKARPSKLPCTKNDKTYFVAFSTIQFVQASDAGTIVVDDQGQHSAKFTLNQLEDILPSDSFVRLHRQTIVNIDWILEIQPWAPGKPLVIINNRDRTQLKSSRSGAAKIKALMEFS